MIKKIKKDSLKILVILIASLIFSGWIYKFNTTYDMRTRNKRNVVFERNLPEREEKIRIEKIFQKGFSFFIDIKTEYKPGENYHHTILDGAEGKIRFILTEYGLLRMYWGSDDVYWEKNVINFHPTTFKLNEWNQVGFVYTNTDAGGILTTFINGEVLWEKEFNRNNPFIHFITLFPGKNENKLGETFIGKARNALFLNRVLSKKEVKESFLYKKPKHLFFKVFLLFVIFNLLFYFLLAFLKKVFYFVKKGDARRVKKGFSKLGFLFSVNVLLFIFFNLGYSAAKYLHSIPQFSDEGIYLFILNILFFTVLFTLFLGKAAGAKLSRSIFLSLSILLLFAFTWIICTFPRFEDIYPFCFNVLLALLYTLIAGSFEILYLDTLTETDR
jgi:hypothetical protein